MAGFGLRGSWCACFIVVAMLLPSLCLGQTEGFGGAQFATVVIPTGGDPDAIAVADLNHDGAPDIAVANPESGTVTVLLGDGKGHFQKASGSPFAAGHLPSDIGIGDFNGDGHPDLLIANHQSSYLTLLPRRGARQLPSCAAFAVCDDCPAASAWCGGWAFLRAERAA